MNHVLKTFEANMVGRDFVIGDLHGAYSLFEKLLKYLNFDPEKDRMFSVGDLIDRGPQSLECLRLIDKPWFHSCRANHEELMIESFAGSWRAEVWIRHGGMWALESLSRHANQKPPEGFDEELKQLREKADKLPYLMTVKRRDGTQVHILHAELPPIPGLTDGVLADPQNVLELAHEQTKDGGHIVWGRHLYYNFYNTDLSNVEKIRRAIAYHFGRNHYFSDKLSPIVGGHTIVHRPFTIMGHTNIDTGAFLALDESRKWTALTCLDINEWKFYQVRPSGVAEVEPFVVSQADVEGLVSSVLPSSEG